MRKILVASSLALGIVLALALMFLLVLVGMPSTSNVLWQILMGLTAILSGLTAFILGYRIHLVLRRER